MPSFMLEKLIPVTEEEKRLLAGGDLERKLYTVDREFVVSAMRLSEGREIAVRAHTRFIPFPTHRHNYAETMIVLAGQITHRIGDRRFTLGAGDVLFMNRHVTHAVERAGEGDIGVNLIVSDSFLNRLAERMSSTVFSSFIEENAKNGGKPSYLVFRTAGVLPLENLEENMLCEITEKEQETQILSDTFALLLTYLSKKQDDLLLFRNAVLSKEEERRAAIASYVREEYRDGTLTDLAGRLALSPTYLSHLVADLFGDTLNRLLSKEKMRRAARLLSETDLSVERIYSAVGFDSSSYFHRAFRKIYGGKPLDYRREHRKEKQKD